MHWINNTIYPYRYLDNNCAWSKGTKKAFKIKFKMVQKRSLNSISLILNIIYYLERQALYDNFFLYPVVIESSLIYIGAWSTLSNIFLMNKNHSFLGSKKFRSAPSFIFICLPEIPRQPPCIWSGSRQLCLFGGGRSNARAHVLHNLASCFSFKMRVCWKTEIAELNKVREIRYH